MKSDLMALHEVHCSERPHFPWPRRQGPRQSGSRLLAHRPHRKAFGGRTVHEQQVESRLHASLGHCAGAAGSQKPPACGGSMSKRSVEELAWGASRATSKGQHPLLLPRCEAEPRVAARGGSSAFGASAPQVGAASWTAAASYHDLPPEADCMPR